MRFWDASAIIPLCVITAETVPLRVLCRSDPGIVVWWGTALECGSALARLVPAATGPDRGDGRADAARDLLRELERTWVEIQPSDEVRAIAGRLVRSHALRTPEALQLAAALSWMKLPEAGEMVVVDPRLARAARIEGLTALP